jgi:putative flippase GtrA
VNRGEGGQGTVARHRLQPLRFVAVGLSVLVIDLVLLTSMRELAHAPLFLATATGQVVGLGWNYAFQRRLTFDSRVSLGHGLPRYLALVGANYLITFGLVTLGSRTGVGYVTGKLAAVAILTPTNFYAYRAWVFPTATRSD